MANITVKLDKVNKRSLLFDNYAKVSHNETIRLLSNLQDFDTVLLNIHRFSFHISMIIRIISCLLPISIIMPLMESSKGCNLRPVIHVLNHQGCLAKPIPSFACHGTCSSYVQVSGSKFWQVERSCMCCQEMGEREATIGIFCPKKTPKFRRVTTKAPVDCMCRPCTGIDDQAIKPQELLNIAEELRKAEKDGEIL